MAEWNQNNRACKTTWTALFVLNQLQEPFPSAGALKMNELTFFTQTGDAQMRKVMARNLAIAMDNIFRLIRHAKFEQGVKPETALQNMVDILVDEKKTVADLAAVNDKNYLFLGESHDD
jgi:lysylphosphatidylglycerol synthetase-like protein (DUF2156 family)